jgi:hypothetical protein
MMAIFRMFWVIRKFLRPQRYEGFGKKTELRFYYAETQRQAPAQTFRAEGLCVSKIACPSAHARTRGRHPNAQAFTFVEQVIIPR